LIGSSFEPSLARNPSAFARAADTARVDARLCHPWLRVNRVLRVMLHTHWSAEAWAEIRVEFKKPLALRSEIRRAGSTLVAVRNEGIEDCPA